jgi:hypothetical protein
VIFSKRKPIVVSASAEGPAGGSGNNPGGGPVGNPAPAPRESAHT